MYKLIVDQSDYTDSNNDFFHGLCQFKSLENSQDFNKYCRWIIDNWPTQKNKETSRFSEYLEKSSIKTPWGGVYITKHEHPLVEKYLVIKGGHYLAFEKHEKKEEHIRVEEGKGILLKRDGEHIRVLPLSKDKEFEFIPGEEHCIIATENMIAFEKSQDHKGMDQDLIFIYTPEE